MSPFDCAWTWPRAAAFAAILVSGAGLMLGALGILLHTARKDDRGP